MEQNKDKNKEEQPNKEFRRLLEQNRAKNRALKKLLRCLDEKEVETNPTPKGKETK